MAREHAPFRNRHVRSIAAAQLELCAVVLLCGCSLMVDVDRTQCARAEDCARRGLSGACVQGVCEQEMLDSSTSAAMQSDAANTQATPLPYACSALLQCCVNVQDVARREQCTELGANGDANACSDAFYASCMSTPPEPPPQQTPCTALEPCCAELADELEREACVQVSNGGEPDACSAATAQYCTGGQPNPNPPPSAACELLESCCRVLYTNDDADTCTRIVADLDETTCNAATAMYCREFDPTLPDSCVTLGKCCSNLRDEGRRHNCESVTADRDDLACQRARDDYCVRRRTQ